MKATTLYMTDVKKWTDQISRENGFRHVYINAGVFFGKTVFLKELLNEALKYITDNDLRGPERHEMHRRGTILENLPDFPRRIGTDQAILRYLHPHFYPRMKIDHKGRLALRT